MHMNRLVILTIVMDDVLSLASIVVYHVLWTLNILDYNTILRHLLISWRLC